MVALLLAASASARGDEALLEAPGRDGWTPLGFAVRAGRVDIATALLEAGASPSRPAVSPSGRTAKEVAAANGRQAMIELLEAATIM